MRDFQFAGTVQGAIVVPVSMRSAVTAGAALLALVASTGRVKGDVEPDADAARGFGAKLAPVFTKGDLDGLIKEVDVSELAYRIVQDRAAAEEPRRLELIRRELGTWLQAFGHPHTVVAYREVVDADVRELEYDFVTAEGMYMFAAFALKRGAGGAVKISDVHFAGAKLSVAEATRQFLLIQHVPLWNVRNPEELQLQSEAQDSSAAVASFVAGLSAGNYPQLREAFEVMTPALQQSRLMYDLMALLVINVPELHPLLPRFVRNDPETPALLRFELAEFQNDSRAAVAALASIAEERHSVVPLAMEAVLLGENGKAAEGFALARRVIDLEPLCTFAYVAALSCAEADHSLDGIEVVKQWAQALGPQRVVTAIETAPNLKGLQSLPAYRTWMAAARRRP